MNPVLIAELFEKPWAMEPSALQALLVRLAALASGNRSVEVVHPFLSSIFGRRQDDDGDDDDDEDVIPPIAKSRMRISNGVAAIPVNGILMKRVPSIFKYYGIGATAYAAIAADCDRAIADPDVHTLVLKVESPGGQVAGVEQAADAIYRAGKEKATFAEIEDIGASGAYWLASQAKHLVANPAAMVGSIGVYSAYIDSSKWAEALGVKVHIVRSGEHKGMGVSGAPITESQLKAMQEVIDQMGSQFMGAVARGRGKEEDAIKSWGSGRVWLSQEAKALGLIDSIGNYESASSGVPGGARSSLEIGGTMPDDKKALEEAQAKGSENARAEERKRISDIKAAFPKHVEFALAQIEKGASLADAKIAFADLLAAENEKLQTEKAELEKKVAAGARGRAHGAPPVQAGGDPDAGGGNDFMALARAHAKETGCKLREAMSHVARTNPKAFEAYRDRCIEAGPEHTARYKQLQKES